MSYELTRSNQITLVYIEDGVVDDTTASLKFVGKDVVDYGEIQNENFLHLLENFSNNTAPLAALDGQLWYDSGTGVLKLYNGTVWKGFPTMAYNSTVTNQVAGDLWYNTAQGRLYINTGTGYVLIGPWSSAETAESLLTPVNINGVSFDGTSDITISSTCTYALLPGSYITGDSYNGSTSTTWSIDVGTVTSATGSKIVARDSAGDIWFAVGHGQATSAAFADLAEKYLPDVEYEVGTVVMIGGEQEITACQLGSHAIGVISQNPAYMMNSELEGGQYVALKGRVPCKVIGPVKKGQGLVAGPNGQAIAGRRMDTPFAIAINDNNGSNVVEALIL